MSKFYTGVGSRQTPEDILDHMLAMGGQFARAGWTLRSGAAEGADSAFEDGAQHDGPMEIYLPWAGFNGRKVARLQMPSLQAYEVAANTHPAWGQLKPGAKALHARNAHQVLGHDLNTRSRFVVCWTPDGCESPAERTEKTGGTATAIVIAYAYGIPVFNLAKPARLDELRKWYMAYEKANEL